MAENKVALITAAGQGMGEAIAREFAGDGYQVALLSSGGGAEKLAAEIGGIALTGSVTNPTDLDNLVQKTMDTHGRIDVVVNNTGHPPKGDLLDIPDEHWHLGLDLLLLNVVRMAKLVTPTLEKQGSGSIINISTFAAFEPDASFPVSSTLRTALASFTKLYADRYAAAGIRMNNVLPGYMDNYPVSENNVKRIPMGRYGAVSELARTVLFLASDGAGYITGQNIRVDGGITRSV